MMVHNLIIYLYVSEIYAIHQLKTSPWFHEILIQILALLDTKREQKNKIKKDQTN